MIAIGQDDVELVMRPEQAFSLIIMVARMLRGQAIPYPYTYDETERIAVADVRRHLGQVEEIAAGAGPTFHEFDKDTIREALDSATTIMEDLGQLIRQLRSETGIDR